MIIHCCFQFFPILIVNFFQFFSNTTPLLHRVWWNFEKRVHVYTWPTSGPTFSYSRRSTPSKLFIPSLVHSKTLIAKCEKISRRRANKIHQLSASFLPWRRTWPRFWGKDPRLESRMKSDTRATRAQIRWTTMAWNSEETIKLGEFTTEFRKGETRNGHKV